MLIDQKVEGKLTKDEDSDALESVLRYVGEMGRYQKYLFVVMAPFAFIIAFVYYVQMFITATPQRHWCTVPEVQHLDLEIRRNLTAPSSNGEWDRCSTFDANWTSVLETMTAPEPSSPTVPCKHGWEFELSDIPYHTVVSERGWVCEFASYAPFAQTMFFAGAFFGGLFFGWLADRFGRLPALVGANLLACFGGVATIFTTGLWDFVFCRFLVGISYDSCLMILYILVLEYVGPQHRTWVGNISMGFFVGGGSVALPWLALWIADWRKLLWATSLPSLLVIGAPLVVPESARWLLSRGRVNQAVDVLRKFERVNKTKIPQDIMEDFIISSRQMKQTDESIGALFRNSLLRRTLVLITIVCMMCSIVFDGVVRLSEGLGLDFFITFTLTSVTEIPAITLLVLVLDRWGRRIVTCAPLSLAGILSLVAAFVPKGAPQVTLAIMARFCINMSFNAVVQWTTELLPTGMRASGSSIVHVSGFIVTMVSPFIVYSERYWRPLPFLTFGVISLMAAGIAILLPETKGKQMPQTIADGERLIRENSLCGKPDTDGDDLKNGKENFLLT